MSMIAKKHGHSNKDNSFPSALQQPRAEPKQCFESRPETSRTATGFLQVFFFLVRARYGLGLFVLVLFFSLLLFIYDY